MYYTREAKSVLCHNFTVILQCKGGVIKAKIW